MKKAILGYAMCLLLTATSAWAAPVISIGTQYMLATDSPRTIPILVSSATAERRYAVPPGDDLLKMSYRKNHY